MTRLPVRIASLVLAALAAGCGGAAPASPTKPAAAPPAPPRVLPGKADGRALLAMDAARVQDAGAGALEVVAAEYLSEGDKAGAFVEVPLDACALVMARGSPSVVDVDLFAYEDDGASFAVDESTDARPAILVCPPHPKRLWLAARVVSGSGLVSLGVQSVPTSAMAAVEQAAGARGRSGGETGRLEAWPGLEAKLLAHRAWLGGRWEDVRRAAVPVAPRAPTRLTVTVEAGRCLDVFVSPSDEVGSLEVVAEDAAGRILARGKERGRDRAIVLCSATANEVTVAMRPRASTGIVAVVASRSAPGAGAALDVSARAEHVTETRELDAARAALAKDLTGKGFGAPKTVLVGSAKLGSRAAAALELPAGCARIDVVAGKPLADAAASLWNDRGALLAEGRGGAGVTLFSCGPTSPARIDVEALARPGPFAVELRKDDAAPAALVAHPLAAARLLAVLDAGGARISAAAASSAQVVALDAGARTTLPFDVSARGCVEVTAALDRGGSGLDLRLADASTGENTVTRGRFVLSDRLCAGDAGAKGNAEIRLLAGKADALVLVRPLPP
ncbi:hypothetical protein [Polyangium fumosum]|uniref:Uncharacterized protein n=1 Tax=Polyangium fumosum TaxID=889272 RepID=A0A4U1IYF0_9BACT|nr:hypothetical protein [Polyangium fumosum]TKC99687.1 hypothetical protein E8A74_37025 [Polyangium fumosum]